MGEAKIREDEIAALKAKAQNDAAALRQLSDVGKVGAVYANTFSVGATADATMARIAFGEQLHPMIKPEFTSAVTMPWPAALSLIQGLKEVHDRVQAFRASPDAVQNDGVLEAVDVPDAPTKAENN